ncbi:peptidoglycan DD-metalloendopeptidase family protein, partial [Yinghuangia seranimata]|uniref:peptidoglycan DD-metalloendopeptidase family protein n=1 Tax=Yinghuangia seranimata TaxID=408067 RepID=UPI00248BB16A
GQQIAIAEKVLASQGPGAWPVCSIKAGLTKGGAAPQVDTGSAVKAAAPKAEAKPAAPQAKVVEAPKAEVKTWAPKTEAPKTEAPAPKAEAPKVETKAAYTVVVGDTLFKIAKSHGISGGWEKLYDLNRSVVGGNPNLIFPGQKLALGTTVVAPAPTQQAPAKQTEDAKPAPAPKADTSAATAKAAPAKSSTKADTSGASETASASGYVRPVPGAAHHNYGNQGSLWSHGHTGDDFAAATGTSVHAVTSGVIVEAGWGGAYGNNVVIKHPDGKYTQYGHLSSISVSVGQHVTTGQQIGLSGATGNVTGPHLHFEVRTGPDYGSDINPDAYLAAHGVNV